MAENEEYATRVREAIAAINQDVPADRADDYDAVSSWASGLRAIVDELIIQRLEPVFNQKLASLPQGSYEDKKKPMQMG